MPKLDLTHLMLPSKHLHTLQTLLAQYVPQAEVWAYGSRVTGGAHEGSDLDVVLRTPMTSVKTFPTGTISNKPCKIAAYPCSWMYTCGHDCPRHFTVTSRQGTWSCRQAQFLDNGEYKHN